MEKGVDTLLEAWALGAPPGVLKIVGDGPEAQSLRAAAPPGVEFRGQVAADEVPSILASARALMVPSRWYEAAPGRSQRRTQPACRSSRVTSAPYPRPSSPVPLGISFRLTNPEHGLRFPSSLPMMPRASGLGRRLDASGESVSPLSKDSKRSSPSTKRRSEPAKLIESWGAH